MGGNDAGAVAKLALSELPLVSAPLPSSRVRRRPCLASCSSSAGKHVRSRRSPTGRRLGRPSRRAPSLRLARSGRPRGPTGPPRASRRSRGPAGRATAARARPGRRCGRRRGWRTRRRGSTRSFWRPTAIPTPAILPSAAGSGRAASTSTPWTCAMPVVTTAAPVPAPMLWRTLGACVQAAHGPRGGDLARRRGTQRSAVGRSPAPERPFSQGRCPFLRRTAGRITTVRRGPRSGGVRGFAGAPVPRQELVAP